jgi:hypothetical protein
MQSPNGSAHETVECLAGARRYSTRGKRYDDAKRRGQQAALNRWLSLHERAELPIDIGLEQPECVQDTLFDLIAVTREVRRDARFEHGFGFTRHPREDGYE